MIDIIMDLAAMFFIVFFFAVTLASLLSALFGNGAITALRIAGVLMLIILIYSALAWSLVRVLGLIA